jgi:hypothetical protein
MTSCGDFEDGASGRLAPAREVLRDEMRAGGGGEMAAGEADTPTLGADGEETGARNIGRACRGAGLGKRAQHLAVWRSISDAVARASHAAPSLRLSRRYALRVQP